MSSVEEICCLFQVQNIFRLFIKSSILYCRETHGEDTDSGQDLYGNFPHKILIHVHSQD